MQAGTETAKESRPRRKRVIAREWLLFVSVTLVFGGLLLPSALTLAFAHEIRLRVFYASLVGLGSAASDLWVSWLLLLVPYLLVQLGRSIAWAVRTVRVPE